MEAQWSTRASYFTAGSAPPSAAEVAMIEEHTRIIQSTLRDSAEAGAAVGFGRNVVSEIEAPNLFVVWYNM